MKVTLHASFRHFAPSAVAGQDVVVIDVLRATTVIAAALDGGAQVAPVRSIAAARRLAKKIGASARLAGERRGLPIAGFHHGNSPVELGAAALTGRTLILTTSNGTRAMERCAPARRIFAASLWNAPAVGHRLRGSSSVALVCAGNSAGIAIEDLVGAGAVIASLGNPLELTDAARIAIDLFSSHRRHLGALLASSASGRYLARIGAGDDVAACAALGRSEVVPWLKNGLLVDEKIRSARA